MALYGMPVEVYKIPERTSAGWANREFLFNSFYAVAIASSEPQNTAYGVLYDNDAFGPALATLDELSEDWLLESLWESDIPNWTNGPSRIGSDHPYTVHITDYLPYGDTTSGLVIKPPNRNYAILIFQNGSTSYAINIVDTSNFITSGVDASSAFPNHSVHAYSGSQAGSDYAKASLRFIAFYYYNGSLYSIVFNGFGKTSTSVNNTAGLADVKAVTYQQFGDFFTDATENFVPIKTGTQVIPVQWSRPGDGKTLSDTFEITVRSRISPSASGSGGSGGSGEGGGGGGHSF